MRRPDILDRKEEILKWIEQKLPKASICRELQCKPETLNAYLDRFGVQYSGNVGAKGHKKGHNKKDLVEFLHNDKFVKSHYLRLRLIKEGVKEERCEICKLTEWNGQKIPLELHHINGNRFDNRLENLLILCPNCHALTPNHSGKSSTRKLNTPL